MPQKSTSATAFIVLTLNLLGWASVPLFLRHFADHIDLWSSNGWRYGFSALVWLPVLLVTAQRRRLPKGLFRAAIVPSIVNAAGQVLFTWAHYEIDPGLLTFGLRTQLLFVAIGAWILFPRERALIRTPGYLIGACLLIAGSTTVLALDRSDQKRPHSEVARETASVDGARVANPVAVNDAHGQQTDRGSPAAHLKGVLLAVGSGLLFACYGLAVRKFMDGINPILAFATICQYTAAALVVLMLILGRSRGLAVLSIGSSEIMLLLLSAIIGIAIGHVFYYYCIARLGVAVTAGVLQLQPFIVAIMSLMLFGELLSGWQWLGGCVAVSGAMTMLAVLWRKSRAASRALAWSIEDPVAIAEGESGV